MKELDRAMKYFILFALGTAVLLPLLFEVYANISRSIALLLTAAWAVFAGVKFSPLPPKSAAVGISAYIFSSVILSLLGYLVIHPAAESWITAHSHYFSLSLSDWVGYWAAAFALLLLTYVTYFAGLGLKKAAGRLRSNATVIASAIDEAFSEDKS